MVFGTRIVFSILLLGFTTRASTGEDRAKPDANQEGQTPVKKEAAAEAPPPPPGPMPDLFGGPIDKRPKLTGNWDDVRNKMAMKGVIADIDLTAVFQHQAAGGSHSDSLLRIGPGRNEDDAEFMGLGEISLIFDMNRTGLWKDGIFKFNAVGRFGDSLTFRSGSLLSTNINAIVPADEIDKEIFDITNFSYTHFIIPKFALFGGLLNTFTGDATPFSGSQKGKSDFLHTDLNVNTVAFGYVPYKTIGGGFIALPHPKITFITTAMNRKEMSGHGPFDANSYNGVTVASELYVLHSIGNKPGGQMFGFGASWNEQLDLEVRPIDLLFDAITIRPPTLKDKLAQKLGIEDPGEKNFTWGITYNAWQYIQVFEGGAPGWSPLMPNARPKGWGAFLRAGASDGNPNFLKFTVSGGLAGDNPARKQDTWGAGGFYRKRSDVLLLKELGLGSECGVEAYYNAGITPWCHVSGHVQYIDTGLPRADNGILFGIRTKIDF